MVPSVLCADGTVVFVLRCGRYRFHGCSAGRFRRVGYRSPVDGRVHVFHRYTVYRYVPNRSFHATKTLGLDLRVGVDLYWPNQYLLSAGNGAVADSLD